MQFVAATLLMLFGVASVVYVIEHPRHALHDPFLLFATLMGGLAASVIGLGGVVLSMVVPRTRERTCVVAASGGTLTLGGVPLAANIAGARVEDDSKGGRWAVALFTGERHPTLVVFLPTREDADQLAAAVTPRVTDAVLSFRFPIGTTRAGVIASLLLIVGIVVCALLIKIGRVAMPLALLAIGPGLALYLVPIRVSVGTDGIALPTRRSGDRTG